MANHKKSMAKNQIFIAAVLSGFGLLWSVFAAAQEAESSGTVQACLKAWGKHPFGAKPAYTTLATSVKVFGIGQNTADLEATDKPRLVVVNPGVNVMGGSQVDLLNPNGWYCLRPAVNVMGGMNIKLHCSAKLASASAGTAVMSGNNDAKGVTVMGAITIERVGCTGN